MRTLHLSEDQIQAITQALGIAEQQCTQQYKSIAQDVVNVRGTHEKPNQLAHASYYHEMACIFADINVDLQSRRLDAKEPTKTVLMIVDFAKKVIQYPVGSPGFDPVDMIRLKTQIQKYDEELNQF